MIRGIYKNIVVVRDIDSPIIEEAIFIVKPNASKTGVSKEDMLSEARRVLEQKARRYCEIGSAPRKKWKFF